MGIQIKDLPSAPSANSADLVHLITDGDFLDKSITKQEFLQEIITQLDAATLVSGDATKTLIHTGGGILTGKRINELQDSSTYSLPLAAGFSDGDIIDILLTDKYSAQTPQVDANVADTIQDVDTSYSGISFNSGAVIVRLISDGSNTWRF